MRRRSEEGDLHHVPLSSDDESDPYPLTTSETDYVTKLHDPSPPSPRHEASPQKVDTNENLQYGVRHLILLTIFSAIGGFLFGYDTGCISGALLFIKSEFSLGNGYQQAVVAIALVGAAVGAPLGGFGADKAGRKVVICASDGLFILGSLVMGAATNVWWLIVGRFIVGLGIGFASNTVPIYLSELAPRASRGTLVTINIVFICTGQFASYLVAALFAHVEGGWRWMLGLGVVPATIQLVGMLLAAPESPRWLLSQQRDQEARNVLQLVRVGQYEISREVDDIKDGLAAEKATWKELFAVGTRRALGIGVALQAFQQLIGINTVMYYAATILEKAGIGITTGEYLFEGKVAAVRYSVLVGLVAMIMSIIALFLIDRIGRRKLALWTLIPTFLGLVALGASFLVSPEKRGGASLFSLLLFLCGFCIGMSTIPWTVNSEIYPLRVRAMCNSIATTTNWISNIIVSATFLSLSDAISLTGVFWCYAVISFCCWVFVYAFLPETKGKSIEAIQEMFRTNSLGIGEGTPTLEMVQMSDFDTDSDGQSIEEPTEINRDQDTHPIHVEL